MPEFQDMTERILYRLSLDPEARALAEKLLGRFRCLVGNLPASADHHHSEPGGLYTHSVEERSARSKPLRATLLWSASRTAA
ncbi:MAG: TraI domain-containing protein [Acidobacteriota bacterium]